MKIYSVWTPGVATPRRKKRDGLPVLVRQGTSGWVLIFGWLALLRSGSRIAGLCAAAVTTFAALALDHLVFAGAVALISHVTLALFASELREWELKLHGFTPQGVVAGTSKDTALLRYLDRNPSAGSAPTGFGQPPAPPQSGTTAGGTIPDPFGIAPNAPHSASRTVMPSEGTVS